MSKDINVKYVEDENGKKYPYVDMGLTPHGHVRRLWISSRLIRKNPPYEGTTIKFPIKGSKITKIGNCTFVLRPDSNTTAYHISINLHNTSYDILSPEGTETFEFLPYGSMVDDLGIWKGVYVNVPNNQPLKYKWHIIDVLYDGITDGVAIITPDGEVHEIGFIPDGLEDIAELPVEEKTERLE